MCSHDVTAAMLVFQNKEMAAMMVERCWVILALMRATLKHYVSKCLITNHFVLIST